MALMKLKLKMLIFWLLGLVGLVLFCSECIQSSLRIKAPTLHNAFEYDLFMRKCDFGIVLLRLLLVGRESESVNKVMGLPISKAGPIELDGSWIAAKAATENWIYDGSGGNANIVVSIKAKRVTAVNMMDFREVGRYVSYQSEKAHKLATAAIGKSSNYLINTFGTPNQIRGRLNSGGKRQNQKSETWIYKTGPSFGASLSIRDGVCTAARLVAFF